MHRDGKLWEKTWVFFGYQYFTQFGKVRPDHFNAYNQMSPSRGTKVREKMRKIVQMGENYEENEEMFLPCLLKDMRVSLRPWTGHRGIFFFLKANWGYIITSEHVLTPRHNAFIHPNCVANFSGISHSRLRSGYHQLKINKLKIGLSTIKPTSISSKGMREKALKLVCYWCTHTGLFLQRVLDCSVIIYFETGQ